MKTDIIIFTHSRKEINGDGYMPWEIINFYSPEKGKHKNEFRGCWWTWCFNKSVEGIFSSNSLSNFLNYTIFGPFQRTQALVRDHQLSCLPLNLNSLLQTQVSNDMVVFLCLERNVNENKQDDIIMVELEIFKNIFSIHEN